MRRRLLAAVAIVALLAGAAPSTAQEEEAPWRFSTLRPAEGPGDALGAMAGGGDVTGDGIDDVVVQLLSDGGARADARVVSGAPQSSWAVDAATGSQRSELALVGPRDRDGRPVPLACDPGIVGDLSGDGIDELVIASCPPPLEVGPPRLWVAFGSGDGGEVRLDAVGAAGFEVDLGSLPEDARIGRVAVLERVDAAGAPGVAVTVRSPSAPSDVAAADSQVRVYRLTGSGGALWAVYAGGSQVRSAGDFHGGGRTDVVMSRYDERGVEVVVASLPRSPDPTPRRVADLGSDETTSLGGPAPAVQYNGVGDVDGDGYDDVAVDRGTTGSGSAGDVPRRSVVLGGSASGDEPHREFAIESDETDGGDLEPPAPMGDLNGDGLDDFAFHAGGDGFVVVYGSLVVEAIDVDLGGPRSTRIVSPQPESLSLVSALIGSRPGGLPRVLLATERALLVFEPHTVAPRRAVAFDGDPATVERIDRDSDELPEEIAPAQAASILRSVAISRRAFPGSGAQHVVVSTVDGFADALAASPLLGGGPLLLTGGDALPEIVRAEIHRVLPRGGRVYVMGGQAAIADEALQPLRDDCRASSLNCYEVQRVAGPSRVETAVAAARLVGASSGGEVAVARAYGTLDASGADVTGAGWADAVTAGGWAAATGTPVLLTATEELHPAVADAVIELGASSTVVLGGTAAVSDEAAAGLPGVQRVAGRDRSETAVAITEHLWVAEPRRILIDGYRDDGWAVGLAAAALAADAGAPLLLTQDGQLPEATAEALRCHRSADVLLVGAAPASADSLSDAVLAAQRYEPAGDVGCRTDAQSANPRVVLSEPLDVYATVHDGGANVYWDPPTHAPQPLLGYRVTATRPDGTLGADRTTSDAETRGMHVPLANEIMYQLRVAAVDEGGEGPPSEPVAVSPQRPPPRLDILAPDRPITISTDSYTLHGAVADGSFIRIFTDGDADGLADSDTPMMEGQLSPATAALEIRVDLVVGVNRFVVEATASGRDPRRVATPTITRRARQTFTPPAGTRTQQAGAAAVLVKREVAEPDATMLRLQEDGTIDGWERAFPTRPGVADDDRLFRWYYVDVPVGGEAEAVAALAGDPDIEAAERLQLYTTEAAPNDPSLDAQHHHALVDDHRAWDATQGELEPGRPVLVGVIDDGFDLAHPELAGRSAPATAFTSGCTTATGDPRAHGTAAAGLIAAEGDNGLGGAGVAYRARLLPVTAGEDVDDDGDGSADRCVISPRWPTALRDLVDRSDAADLRVVNLSFGAYQHSQLAADAVRHAIRRGVVVVASAGNDATNASHYPSDFYHVLSVAAANRDDLALADSNYGPEIDLAAPGDALLTTAPGGGEGRLSGTSAAAAVATGGVALTAASYGERSHPLRHAYLAALDRAASDPHPDGLPQEHGETYGEGHSNHQRAANYSR